MFLCIVLLLALFFALHRAYKLSLQLAQTREQKEFYELAFNHSQSLLYSFPLEEDFHDDGENINISSSYDCYECEQIHCCATCFHSKHMSCCTNCDDCEGCEYCFEVNGGQNCVWCFYCVCCKDLKQKYGYVCNVKRDVWFKLSTEDKEKKICEIWGDDKTVRLILKRDGYMKTYQMWGRDGVMMKPHG